MIRTKFWEGKLTKIFVYSMAIVLTISTTLGAFLVNTTFAVPDPFNPSYKIEGQRVNGTFTTGNICSGTGDCYAEGQNVPFKVTIENLIVGDTYTIKVQHDYEDTNNIIGYVNFNTPGSWDGSASNVNLSNPVTSAGLPSTITYDLSFQADSADVELKFSGLLGDSASQWNGAQLHARLVVGVEGENIGNKDVPISVGELIVCGDGQLDPGEECDDGNNIDGDGCSAQCLLEPNPETIADLSITKSGFPDPADCGESLNYTLVITNNGPDTAEGIVVTDDLPPAVAYSVTNVTPSQGSCSDITEPDIQCELGSLSSGSSATILIEGIINNIGSFIINNHAAVSAETLDNNLDNNTVINQILVHDNCYFCGDGNVDEGEECDDANTDPYDGCANDCTLTYCGDNYTQAPNGYNEYEECDGDQPQECTTIEGYSGFTYCTECAWGECQSEEYCGDNIVNGNEECDGQAGVPEHYSCTQECTLEYVPYCGDGNLDDGEECDWGQGNNQGCEPPYEGSCDYCNATCELVTLTDGSCGDGNWDEPYEECDDGNNINNDGCNAFCQLEYCGDEIINGSEECDGDQPQICTTDTGYEGLMSCEQCFWGTCESEEYCGDNIINGPEECDGDEPQQCTTGTGYSGYITCTECLWGTCESEEYCGDNIVNGEEECDGQAGEIPEHYTCNQECALEYVPYCGDNIVNGEEECDGQEGCTQDCTWETPPEPYCGDGQVNQQSEECDGQDGVPEHYTCTQECTLEYVPYCGDGNVDDGEQCDDGNNESGDGCSSSCTTESTPPPPPPESYCGNGIVEDGETCDDGNTESGDGCSSSCTTESTPVARCGNGILEPGEACDDGNNFENDGCSAICALGGGGGGGSSYSAGFTSPAPEPEVLGVKYEEPEPEPEPEPEVLGFKTLPDTGTPASNFYLLLLLGSLSLGLGLTLNRKSEKQVN